ncbi:integral membrane protein [soil metagenome]
MNDGAMNDGAMKRIARRSLPLAILAAGWTAATWVVWTSVVRGRALQRSTPEIFLGAAPLVGRNYRDGWDWRFGWTLVASAALAAFVVVGCLRSWWPRLRLRWLLLGTAAASMLFAVLLALSDGTDGLLYPAEHRTEYLANVGKTPPGLDYLHTFVHLVKVDHYSVHVRGHPPGYLGLLKVLDWIGIGGAWTTAMLSVLATGITAIAVLLVVRVLAGRQWVDRIAPFLVVAPYLVWMVTSADAVYTGLAALGTAALAIGAIRRRWLSAGFGLAGGLLLGAVLFGTYLGAVFLIVPIAVIIGIALLRRRIPVAVVAGAIVGAIAVTLAFRAAGFWWFDGLAQTKIEYHEGTAQFRPWSYFNIGNIGAALIAVGPAVVTGLCSLRDRRVWIASGAAIAAIAASHLSKYTKAEVERIWLLFYPWVTIAAGSLFVGRTERARTGAIWVGVQAATAIVLQAALVSKW